MHDNDLARAEIAMKVVSGTTNSDATS